MRHLAATLALVATLSLTACDGGRPDEGGASIRAGVPTTSSTQPKPTESKIGKTQSLTVDNSQVAATVNGYRQPLTSEDRPSRTGYVFAGVDVRMCIKAMPDGVPAQVSAHPWSLVYGDDTRVESSFEAGESFMVPLYPQDGRAVAVGDCVRGWIVFEVPEGRRPAAVLYVPTETETPTQPLRWPIGR